MNMLAPVVAFTVAALCTGWIVSRGRNRWLVDHPNARSLHDRPVSRAGGMAILAGLAAGLAIVALDGAPAPDHLWALAGGLIVVSVSFTDDIRRVSPAIRIVFHLAAAGCVVLAGLSIDRIVLPGRGAASRSECRCGVYRAVRGVGCEPVQFHGWDGRSRRRHDSDRLHDARGALRPARRVHARCRELGRRCGVGGVPPVQLFRQPRSSWATLARRSWGICAPS